MQEILKKACLVGGEVMRKNLHLSYATDTKPKDFSLVTDADKASEEAIIAIINAAYPDHAILSEECGACGVYEAEDDQSFRWIIDPIDGTTNFFHKSPFCGVSIAVEHRSQIVMSGVYCPFIDEFFFAERHQGAFLNGVRFTIPSSDMPVHHMTAVLYNIDKHYGDPSHHQPVYHRLLQHKVHSRKLGASAVDISWVALGRVGAFISAYPVNVWDIAAAVLILEEAGGKVSQFDGQAFQLHSSKNIIGGSANFVNLFLTNIV